MVSAFGLAARAWKGFPKTTHLGQHTADQTVVGVGPALSTADMMLVTDRPPVHIAGL
jgi:hypothetical protein